MPVVECPYLSGKNSLRKKYGEIRVSSALVLSAVSLLLMQNSFVNSLNPCLSGLCLSKSIDEFAAIMDSEQRAYNLETRPVSKKLTLKNSVTVHGQQYRVDFAETTLKSYPSNAQLLFWGTLKNISDKRCEAEFNKTLEFLSSRFGRFAAIKANLPDDYLRKYLSSKNGVEYRRIQSPRGQIAFQSKLENLNLWYDLKAISTVLTSRTEEPDCRQLIWFSAK